MRAGTTLSPRWTFGLFALLLILVCPSRGWAQTVDDFEERYHTSGGRILPYRLWVPRDYDPKKPYPLVLFLHGAGGSGTDNRGQLSGGAPFVFVRPESQAKYPCFMLAPQCPRYQTWTNSVWQRMYLETLIDLFGEFNLDPNRLYITGMSLGGFGTWDAICRYPGVFAAAIPIAGAGFPWLANRCADTPIWAFHSDDDPLVPVEWDRTMIDAVRRAGGKPLYTEYTGLGHNIATIVYAEPDFLPWLFAQ